MYCNENIADVRTNNKSFLRACVGDIIQIMHLSLF